MQQTVLDTYRLQYIFSGAQPHQFAGTLASLTTAVQLERIHAALAAVRHQRQLVADGFNLSRIKDQDHVNNPRVG